MSGFIVCTNTERPVFDIGSVCRITFLTVCMGAISLAPVQAGALDWLNSNLRAAKAKPVKAEVMETQQLRIANFDEQKLSGNDLDSYKFAQSHFTHSRNRMEKVCRVISSRYNDAAVRDILQKIYVIDTQIFRENIKNSALAVKEVLTVNDTVGQGLQDLTRVVTAPGQETLDSLEKTLDRIGSLNLSQILLVKKHLTGAEKTIEIAQAAYETLELIPSLSLAGLDLLVQMSKQLMRMTQSNSEAFKGLLLNVQSSTEQVSSGLENIKKTVRETLRFSDHFAIKQFPLINLPAPSREKIFVQLNSLTNSVKGVENTVAIGDSQVRNTAQQFTHLISGFVDKADESMKYQAPDSGEKALEQISTYARNQVSGLFLRVKEDIAQMRTEMAKAARPNQSNIPPAVNFESRDEFAARKAVSASSQKLPLFLLGGAAGNEVSVMPSQPSATPGDGFIALEAKAPSRSANKVKVPSTQVLYDEKSFGADDSDLMQPEVNILTQELGSDFFFADKGENLSKNNLMAQGSDMPGYGEEDSLNNLNDSGEPEIELLKYDSVSTGKDSEDLLPMMRFDSDALTIEEE